MTEGGGASYEPGSEADLNHSVQDAINQWLSRRGGGFVTSFYLQADYISDEGNESWTCASAPDQRLSQTMGLWKFGEKLMAHEFDKYMAGEYSDGDE